MREDANGPYLSTDEAAAMLGVSNETVRRRIEDKSLEAENHGPKDGLRPRWRIRPAAVQAYLQETMTGARDPDTPPD